MSKIKVLLVDNHPITIMGLQSVLSESLGNTTYEIIGKEGEGNAALKSLLLNRADVVILDIEMPGISGLEVAEQIKANVKLEGVKILIYTNHNSRVLASEAIARGVDGYVLKDSPPETIPIAVEKIFNGEFYIDKNLKIRPVPKPLRPAELTAIELNIICLILKQFADKEIADKLKISIEKIENNKRSIRKKTGALNTVGIVLYAIEHNLCKYIIDLDS